jgi:uncharacterized protein (DUF2342 family)
VNRSSTGEGLEAVEVLSLAACQGGRAETVADAARSSRVTGGGAVMSRGARRRQVGDELMRARRAVMGAAWCLSLPGRDTQQSCE